MAADRQQWVQQIAARWKARGYKAAEWADPAGKVWSNLSHHSDAMFVVIEGDMLVEFAGKTWNPEPGEELVIPRSVPHTIRNAGNRPCMWLYGTKSA